VDGKQIFKCHLYFLILILILSAVLQNIIGAACNSRIPPATLQSVLDFVCVNNCSRDAAVEENSSFRHHNQTKPQIVYQNNILHLLRSCCLIAVLYKDRGRRLSDSLLFYNFIYRKYSLQMTSLFIMMACFLFCVKKSVIR